MDKSIFVQISEKFIPDIDPESVRQAADQAIKFATPQDQFSLTLIFAGDEELQQLNNQFLGIDSPTDVLSFPADFIDPDMGMRYLGDILISVPRAIEQAASADHPLEEEMQLLVVHGVLHLLGYDHLESNEKERMQAAQDTILHLLGNELTINL